MKEGEERLKKSEVRVKARGKRVLKSEERAGEREREKEIVKEREGRKSERGRGEKE